MRPVTEISISIIFQMLRYLSGFGVNPEEFLKDAGVSVSLSDSPDKRVPVEQFLMIQKNALHVTGDKTFGLHLGECVEAGNLLILGYIVMNCRSLSGALERMCRYGEVVSNFIQMSLSVKKQEAKLSFDINIPDSIHIGHCYDASVSGVMKMIRLATGKAIKPNRITFQHEAPENTKEYERILNCPVLFNQKNTTIVFNRSDLDTPIKMHNPVLLELFEQHAKAVVDTINYEQSYTHKVNSLIVKWLAEGTPTIDKVAKELSLSVRSLQGRLKDEGVTFRLLLENSRKELSASYLKDKRFTVDDITYLLGFSEPSIFRKAFKKWTGMTPGDFRKHQEPDKKYSVISNYMDL